MRIEDATDVFCESFAFTRSFSTPYKVVRVGGLRVMRDGAKRREPRTQEIIVCGLAPEDALAQVREYQPPRHFLCAMISPGEDRAAVKDAYKAAGYRMTGGQDLFVRDLSQTVPASHGHVRRITTLEAADVVTRAARGHAQIRPEQLRGNEVRLFAAYIDGNVAGWVRSIHLRPEAAWVSNLYVKPECRRKGLGHALMTALLESDKQAGAKHSVLLASRVGAMLYPHLGYERIGELLMFVPKKPS